MFISAFVRYKNLSSFQCEVCELAKHHRAIFPLQSYKPSKPFSIVHSDIWGPSRISTFLRKRWFITFIDDHTRIGWVYLLKEESEAEKVFKDFHKTVQTQFQITIQIFRSNNEKEYFNRVLGKYFAEHGIIHQSSCSNTLNKKG